MRFVFLTSVLFLSLGAEAQSISIRKTDTLRVVSASVWTNAPQTISSARLVGDGEWVTLSQTTLSTYPDNNWPRVTQISLERWGSEGIRNWRVERQFTNVISDEIIPSQLERSDSNQVQLLLKSVRHGTLQGSELWSVDPSGVLTGEKREFANLWRSIQILNNQVLLARPTTFEDLPNVATLEIRDPLDGALRSQVLLRPSGTWGKLVELNTNRIVFLDQDYGVIHRVTPAGVTVQSVRPVTPIIPPNTLFDFRLYDAIRTSAGVVYGGNLWSVGASTASQTFGGSDAWLGWFGENGAMRFDRSFGGAGSEQLNAMIGTPGGGVLLAIQSSGSGVTGNKTVDGDGVWLVHVSHTGILLSQALLAGHQFLAMESHDGQFWLLTQSADQFHSTRVQTESSVTVSAGQNQPFDLQLSDDLKTWKTIGTGVTGDLTLTQPVDRGTRFYRATPSGAN